MKPQSSGGQESAPKQQEKLSGKDLDSSLVHLAGSLAINGSSNKVKYVTMLLFSCPWFDFCLNLKHFHVFYKHKGA